MFKDFDYKNKELYFKNFNLLDIVKKEKTPIYVYSKQKIEENVLNYKKAFEKNSISNYQICYAMKANDNSEILKILKNLGLGIDAVSANEIKKAVLIGFDVEKIVFSGVGKTREELIFAIKNKIGQINIESYEEFLEIIEICKEYKITANISIRINPNIKAHTHKKITTGTHENKFGVNIEVAEKIINEIFKINEENFKDKKQNLLNLKGLSGHIGSQILEVNDFEEFFKIMSKIYKKYNNSFATIDVGGGVGVKYKNSDKSFSYNDYVFLIKKYFNDFGGKIIIEPGRSIVANAGILVSQVVRVKRTQDNNFVILDSGMNNLIRPAMYGAKHIPMVLKINSNKKEKYTIVGPICESSDVFIENFRLNTINKGDFIAFLCSGAYGRTMASNYNLQDIASEMMIDGDKYYKIRKNITYKDFLKFENF